MLPRRLMMNLHIYKLAKLKQVNLSIFAIPNYLYHHWIRQDDLLHAVFLLCL